MSHRPLIHIGLHKTGTKWLQRWIFTEGFGFTGIKPRTVMDDAFLGGNPYKFDNGRTLGLLGPFIESAERTSTVLTISHEPLAGQPFINALDSPMLAGRLHKTFPDARVLIVVREQRSMMLSTYKQYVKVSGTEQIDRFWREREPSERRRPTPGLGWLEYHHVIDHYQRTFGPESVLVLAYEHLRSDPLRFVGDICSFVGVEIPDHVPADERENVSLPGLHVALLRQSNKVLRAFGLVEPFGGPVISVRLRRARRKSLLWTARRTPRALSGPFDRRLKESIARIAEGRFGQSNLTTQELTGLDLASLGYDVGR